MSRGVLHPLKDPLVGRTARSPHVVRSSCGPGDCVGDTSDAQGAGHSTVAYDLSQEPSRGLVYFARVIDISRETILVNMAVRMTTDVGLLGRACDTACKELGIKLDALDVPTRDRLVERILRLLSTRA